MAFDAAGLFPGFGEPFDAVSALLAAARGDYTGAAMSAASMLPIAGWGSSAAKWLGHLKDVPASTVLDASTLRNMAEHTEDVTQAIYARQLADGLDAVAARGAASPAELDALLRRAADQAPAQRQSLEVLERASAKERREIAGHLKPVSNFDARTAGGGGIWDNHAGISRNNEHVATVNGEVLDPQRLPDGRIKRANLEKTLPSPELIDSLKDRGYQRAHLWGPQFGDEAANGIMYAPGSFNTGRQRVLEATIAGMRKNLDLADGERLVLQARATSFPRDQFGGQALSRAEYDFAVVRTGSDGRTRIIERVGVSFKVDPPPKSTWQSQTHPGGLIW